VKIAGTLVLGFDVGLRIDGDRFGPQAAELDCERMHGGGGEAAASSPVGTVRQAGRAPQREPTVEGDRVEGGAQTRKRRFCPTSGIASTNRRMPTQPP
jgi:hypothetical protein